MRGKFDPIEFLTLAEDLANRVNNEASLRTAISRAYYAAYHKSLESLLSYNRSLERIIKSEKERTLFFGRGISEHRAVHQLIRDKLNEGAGSMLYQLFRLRKRADYDLNVRISSDDVSKSLKLSKTIINELLRVIQECQKKKRF